MPMATSINTVRRMRRGIEIEMMSAEKLPSRARAEFRGEVRGKNPAESRQYNPYDCAKQGAAMPLGWGVRQIPIGGNADRPELAYLDLSANHALSCLV